jgi:4-amino-4-deoxy-L-arabinose transferase-like glycosyltransferase
MMQKYKGIWAVSFCFLAFHAGLAIWLPLVDDETYYALWATEFSLGYYDHPPMVAWGISLGQKIVGAELGVRLFPLLAFAVTTILVGRTAVIYCRDWRAGILAALLFNLTLPVLGLGFAATPDAPLVLFWTAAIWAMAEGVSRQNRRWWMLVGLFAALAVQSKFTALFLGVGVVLWVLATASGRTHLRSGYFWASGLVALVVMGPLLLWNWWWDWVGLERQFSRIGTEATDLTSLWEFLGSTPLLISPLVFLFAIIGLRQKSQLQMPLLLIHLPIVVFMVEHSLGARVQGNWLLPTYPWVAVLATAGLLKSASLWKGVTVGSAAILGAGVLVIGLKSGEPVFKGDNPFNQTKGWEAAASDLRAATMGYDWVATTEYAMTGRMAWIAGPKKTWSVLQPERYLFRGLFRSSNCDGSGVLVERADRGNTATSLFGVVGKSTEVHRVSDGSTLQTYRLTPVSDPLTSDLCD